MVNRILLIIGGGIAAYKCLDLARRLAERGIEVRAVMTAAAQRFITPLSVAAITGRKVHTALFDADEELDIGHIRLSREADLIVVAPATADLLAKMAGGHGDDLASAVLLAADKPVLLAPAMNPLMWSNPATQRNVALLEHDGRHFIGPNSGEMAERGEAGIGRMAEPLEIADAIEALLQGTALGVRTAQEPRKKASDTTGQLAGYHVLVTAGPTHEPIDPVRYIANRSSGKQGYAIAAAAARAGARVTLVSGPVGLDSPAGCDLVKVETAREMLAAVEAALPADVGIFAAAVADWRAKAVADEKIKKKSKSAPAPLKLVENPDILRTVAQSKARRPALMVGFAAETEDVVANAQAKLKKKGCDWILANDVSPETGVMGGDSNTIHLITRDDVDSWPTMGKEAVAEELVSLIVDFKRLGSADV